MLEAGVPRRGRGAPPCPPFDLIADRPAQGG